MGGTVKAVVIDTDGTTGELASSDLSISKKGWKIIDQPEETQAKNAIDDNPGTFWNTHPYSGEKEPPQSFTVDMGATVKARGFTYLPRQDGTTHGMTDKYIFEISLDNQKWEKAAEGEFSNLRANPIEHSIPFKSPRDIRYFRFTGTRALDKKHVSAAEVGIIPEK